MSLAAVPEPDDAPDNDATDMAALVEQELMLRLREKPASLPAAFLTKMFLEGKKQAEAPEPVMEQADVLAAMTALPKKHALALIQAELERARAVVERYEAELAKVQRRKA